MIGLFGDWTPLARRAMLWGIFLPILFIIVSLTCILLPIRKVSVGEVKSDVNRNLPIGSTTAETVSFLEDRDIGFSGPAPLHVFGTFIPGGDEVPDDTLVIQGIIRDTSYPYTVFVTTLHLYFFFDDEGTLIRFEVEETGGSIEAVALATLPWTSSAPRVGT